MVEMGITDYYCFSCDSVNLYPYYLWAHLYNIPNGNWPNRTDLFLGLIKIPPSLYHNSKTNVYIWIPIQ
jgi:hypothetical protein